jgi:hypothetical protein
MAENCFHASIESAQHGAKSLAQFLDYANKRGISGAEPSNLMLGGDKKGIEDSFANAKLSLDGVSAHCPIWVQTIAWTASPTSQPLRIIEPGWQKRGMQFWNIPDSELNMTRYAELLIHTGYPQPYWQVIRARTAPLVVGAERYCDVDATGATGIRFVRDNLCFPLAAGSFEDGRGSQPGFQGVRR